jgi:hypothetical protein
MLLRLERSLRRLGARTSQPLTDRDWQVLRSGVDAAP